MATKIEEEGARAAASLMAVAARTAPKGRGDDSIEIVMVEKKDIEKLACAMEEIADERDLAFFKRDAGNVRKSEGVLLVGLLEGFDKLNCGACGFEKCREMTEAAPVKSLQNGPNCAIKLIDLGIAIGSAVKTAQVMNVDNRIMFSAGCAAMSLGLVESKVCMGIPLSVAGKNVFFDRK